VSATNLRRLGVLAALLLASCVPWWRGEVRVGDLIKAPHARHLAAQVDCLQCHETVYDATDLSARHMPPESTCLQCHDEQKQKGNCGFCHTDVKRAGPWAAAGEPAIHVNHAAHLPRTKEECSECHTSLPNPVRTRQTAPPMSACLSCHEHRKEYDEGRCDGCHTDLSRYGTRPVSVFSHQSDFVHNHAAPARSASATCAQCHEQTHCADCHARTVSTPIEVKFPERVFSNFIHRNDFISRHATEASADQASCRRCHGSSFCEDCHRVQNLAPQGSNARDPHPQGWSFPGSANFHGTAARRDIASCAACHDQGARSICVDCHKEGGIGGNPHPPGWSDRHGRDEIGRNGMCLACHR